MEFHQAFDHTLKKFKITAKVLSEQTKLSEPTISAARNGQDIRLSTVEALMAGLPYEAQQFLYEQWCPHDIPVEQILTLIETFNANDLANVLEVVSRRVRYDLNSDSDHALTKTLSHHE